MEKNFKYSTVVISMFSEHINMFRTLSILIFDNSNVNNDKTKTKQKMAISKSFFFLQTFQNDQIFLHHVSERSHFGIKSCSY